MAYKDMVVDALLTRAPTERHVPRAEVVTWFDPKKSTYVLRAIGVLIAEKTLRETEDGVVFDWNHINSHIIQHVQANRAMVSPSMP